MILIYLFLTYIFTEFILRKFLTGKRASTTWIYAHEHLGFKQIEFTVFLLFIPSILLVLWQNKNSEAVYTYGFTLVLSLGASVVLSNGYIVENKVIIFFAGWAQV